MTTDTVRKEVVVEREGFTVGGIAKGAAMLAPDMATMLAVLTTDAPCDPRDLYELLRDAANAFRTLIVDGSTSTNDTVLVLANGLAGGSTGDRSQGLGDALGEACASLAAQMAADAEGSSKVVRVRVRGAPKVEDADRAARKVVGSLLVKCSLNGEDPYWGRILSELGACGVAFDPGGVTISYGGVAVCAAGMATPHDADAVTRHLAGRDVTIDCDLGAGSGEASVLGTDLGHGYIDENRRTS